MGSETRTLGEIVRTVRQKNGWTLRQMSEKVGIPVSTLGKVETDKLSLTYDKLQQFTSRLGLTIAELLSQGDQHTDHHSSPPVTARRSITANSNSIHVDTPNYDYEYLCADLREKRMVPLLVRIRAHDAEEFGEPVSHEGEEFIFVLEGKIEVQLQFYTSVILEVGQGIYIDSSMRHAYVAKDCESALVLAVCSGDAPDLAVELMTALAEAKRAA